MLSAYEEERNQRIASNKELLGKLGLDADVAALAGAAGECSRACPLPCCRCLAARVGGARCERERHAFAAMYAAHSAGTHGRVQPCLPHPHAQLHAPTHTPTHAISQTSQTCPGSEAQAPYQGGGRRRADAGEAIHARARAAGALLGFTSRLEGGGVPQGGARGRTCVCGQTQRA
jgi:hypothetical protein